jgi:hypothetical protein
MEIIKTSPDGNVTNKIVKPGEINNRHTSDLILECRNVILPKDTEEDTEESKKNAEIVSIRVPNHQIKINLTERTIQIKDLGTEIRSSKSPISQNTPPSHQTPET